jgi:hypothetical protein
MDMLQCLGGRFPSWRAGSGQRGRVALLGDHHPAAANLADVETEPLDQHVEAEHIWIGRGNPVPRLPWLPNPLISSSCLIPRLSES